MAASLPFRVPSSSSALFLESSDLPRPRATSTICNALRDYSSIPNLGTFSKTRSRIEQELSLPFIQRTENELLHYCSTLEGDACYECWTAYFELKDLEEEVSKDKIECLLRQAGDLRSLVRRIHSASRIYKNKRKNTEEEDKNNNKEGVGTAKPLNAGERVTQSERPRPFPVPDGLPKTQEEIEEEEKVRMQDSPYTKLLRRMGKPAAWFTPRPDHETD